MGDDGVGLVGVSGFGRAVATKDLEMEFKCEVFGLCILCTLGGWSFDFVF